MGQKFRENIYVDNVITGTSSVQDAINLYNVGKKLFKTAAMNLRDWMSNSEEVLNEIPECDKANREGIKVLGLAWSVKEGYLSLSSQRGDELILSKRTVLQQTVSVYDLLGLFSPVKLRGKIFLQDLWSQKISWDRHLSEQDKRQWYSIKEDLKELNHCQFPRYIGLDQKGMVEHQILVFCDASKYAYGAAVYLRQIMKSAVELILYFQEQD